ncbi:hypothetical protein J4402_02740 [Candidatus Pacearchaeota archaeon]|nr:hypothetical protein [Candidatus Pacearchaeota archaeon]
MANNGYYESALLYFSREILEGRREKFPSENEIRDYAETLRSELEESDSFDNDESGIYLVVMD